WGSVSFILGSAASAPLVHAWSPAIVPSLLIVPNLVLAPVLMLLPRSQRGHADHVRPPWTLLTPRMAAFLTAVFLAQMSCGSWGGFFALHVQRLGLSDSIPGVTFALAVVVEVVLYRWGRRVLEWIRPVDLILVTLVASVVRWTLSAVVTSEVAVVAVQL